MGYQVLHTGGQNSILWILVVAADNPARNDLSGTTIRFIGLKGGLSSDHLEQDGTTSPGHSWKES